MQRSRKEILRKAKEDAEQLLRESNAKIENTIKTIREAQAEKEKTRNVRQELDEFKKTLDDIEKQHEADKIARKMQQLHERKKRQAERKEKKASEAAMRKAQPDALLQAAQEAEVRNRPLQPGETVRIKGQTTVGTIEEIDGKNAIVTFGMMRTNVKPERLERAAAPEPPARNQAPPSSANRRKTACTRKKLNFKQDIDVRGMRGTKPSMPSLISSTTPYSLA